MNKMREKVREAIRKEAMAWRMVKFGPVWWAIREEPLLASNWPLPIPDQSMTIERRPIADNEEAARLTFNDIVTDRCATVAILAMREPTKEMVEAGRREMPIEFDVRKRHGGVIEVTPRLAASECADPANVFRAMLDAAIK